MILVVAQGVVGVCLAVRYGCTVSVCCVCSREKFGWCDMSLCHTPAVNAEGCELPGTVGGFSFMAPEVIDTGRGVSA